MAKQRRLARETLPERPSLKTYLPRRTLRVFSELSASSAVKEKMTQITIRPLASHDDYQQTRQIHMATWGVGASETIPPLTVHALQHNGGSALGAYDGDRLVGYVLGTLGTIQAPDRIDQILEQYT